MKSDRRYLKIWHTQGHDDFTTSQVLLKPSESAQEWAENAARMGGFWKPEGFVPWHKINYIEIES